MAQDNTVEIAVQIQDLTRAGVRSIQTGMDGVKGSIKSVTDTVFSLWGALAGGAAVGVFAVISEDLRKAEQAAIDAAQGSTEALQKMQTVAKEVWLKGFGGNATEAAQMVTTAFKEMGNVSEAELGKAATAAAQLESRFGADYQKTLQSIGVLMRDFGISAKEATDFVSAGFIKNLDSSGDFLDSITEYSTQFKEAGAGAGEFYSALETGAGRGIIGTDAVADSFKELNDKIKSGSTDVKDNLGAIGLSYDKLANGLNNGTVSTTDAFNSIQKAIKETENSTTQFQAGAALLGEPFIKMGQEAFLAIDTTKTKISELSGSTEKLNQGYVGLAASFTKLSREIIDAFSGEILSTSKQVEDQINLIIKAVQDLKSSGALKEWADGAGQAFSIALGWLKEFISYIPKMNKNIQSGFADIDIFYNKVVKKLNEIRAAVAGFGNSDNPQVAYFKAAAAAAEENIKAAQGVKDALNDFPELKIPTAIPDMSLAYATFLDNVEGLEAGTLKWGETTKTVAKEVAQTTIDLAVESTKIVVDSQAEQNAIIEAGLENIGNKAAEPKPVNIETDEAEQKTESLYDSLNGLTIKAGEKIPIDFDISPAQNALKQLMAETQETMTAAAYALEKLKTQSSAGASSLPFYQLQQKALTDQYRNAERLYEDYKSRVEVPVKITTEFKGKASPVKPLSETFANIQTKFSDLKKSAAAGLQSTLAFNIPKPSVPQLAAGTSQNGLSGLGGLKDLGKMEIVTASGKALTIAGDAVGLKELQRTINRERKVYA